MHLPVVVVLEISILPPPPLEGLEIPGEGWGAKRKSLTRWRYQYLRTYAFTK